MNKEYILYYINNEENQCKYLVGVTANNHALYSSDKSRAIVFKSVKAVNEVIDKISYNGTTEVLIKTIEIHKRRKTDEMCAM